MSRRRKSDDAPMSFFAFQDIISCTTGIMVLLTLLLTMELMTRKMDVKDTPETKEELPDMAAILKALKAEHAANESLIGKNKAIIGGAGDQDGPRITRVDVDEIREKVDALDIENGVREGQIPQLTDKRDEAAKKEEDIIAASKEARDELKGVKDTLKKLQKQPPLTVVDKAKDGRIVYWVECSKEGLRVFRMQKGSGLFENVTSFSQKEKGSTARKVDQAFLAWAKTSRNAENDKFVFLVRPDSIVSYNVKLNGKTVHRNRLDVLRGALRAEESGFVVGIDVWPTEFSLMAGVLEEDPS
jgi:hypothetical protein